MADHNFIQDAIKRPGALRRKLKTAKGKNIPVGKLHAAAKAPGRTGRQARLAITLRKISKKRGRK